MKIKNKNFIKVLEYIKSLNEYVKFKLENRTLQIIAFEKNYCLGVKYYFVVDAEGEFNVVVKVDDILYHLKNLKNKEVEIDISVSDKMYFKVNEKFQREFEVQLCDEEVTEIKAFESEAFNNTVTMSVSDFEYLFSSLKQFDEVYLEFYRDKLVVLAEGERDQKQKVEVLGSFKEMRGRYSVELVNKLKFVFGEEVKINLDEIMFLEVVDDDVKMRALVARRGD